MGGEIGKSETINARNHRGVKGAPPPAGGTRTKMKGRTKIVEDNLPPNTSPKKKGKEKEKLIRKKEKIAIVAKNKNNTNEELKVMELIQEKNPKKIDYDLIYESIGKHFLCKN